jgi:hypothetical protein
MWARSQKMKKNIFFFVVALALVVSAFAGVTPVAAAQVDTWDQAVCDGLEAVVWREVNATTSDMPSTEGCAADAALTWLVVEPWGSNGLNPDRACLAADWNQAYTVAQAMSWTNGSAWRVSVDLADNPLVVACGEVDLDAKLGLNPGEGQIELRTIEATVARAAVLLARQDMTMVDYAEQYPDHPISELFQLLVGLGLDS